MTLKGLEEVHWAALWVGGGLEARVLPQLLEQVASGTEGAALHALTELRRTVSIGRQWSEAAAPTVPFLVQALARAEDGRRQPIVELLHDVGAGSRRALFPARPVQGSSFEPEPPEDEEEDEFEEVAIRLPSAAEQARWQLECHVSVELVLPVVLPLLEEVDDALVSSVIALLASFPEAAPLSTPALWKLAREEDDSPLGGQALVALAQLGAAGVVDAARVTTDAHQGTPLAFWAAVADVLASSVPNAVAIHQLIGLPKGWGREPCPFTGKISRLRRRVLGRLPRASVRQAIAAVVAHPDFASRISGARLVVRWAVASSGEDRRAALKVLAQRGPWGDPSFVRLLEEYELPTVPHELVG